MQLFCEVALFCQFGRKKCLRCYIVCILYDIYDVDLE